MWCVKMKNRWLLILVVVSVCASLASHVDAANLLVFFPLPARSHWFALRPLIAELSNRGHNITLVISEVEKDLPDNWEIIRVPVILPPTDGNRNAFQTQSAMVNGWVIYTFLSYMGSEMCEKYLQHEVFQNLIETTERKFDLLLMEFFMNECLIAYSHKFSVPVVALSSFGGFPMTTDVVGDPYLPSYVPDTMFEYTDQMTFWQRLKNGLLVMYARCIYSHWYYPKLDKIVHKYFNDPTMPSVSTLLTNTSLVILQSHVSFSYPRPHVPNVIETGGMHIQQPQALPKDLKKLMDAAEDGIIFFSMGSAVKSSDFPEEKLQAFIGAFSRLKQLVLWKWENDTMPGKPPNVHLSKWFPQSDLLAHKNMRLFMSHGGLQSTLEATARGVPLIGMPVMAEQRYNVQRVVKHGYGIRLDLTNVTAQSVEWAVYEVLSNPKYRENAKLRSRLFWDRPESPVETAVYWTEYVLRHRGAPHLRSAALHLSWYQYLLLDVAALLLSGALLVLTIAVVAVRTLYRLITARTSASHQQKKKKTMKKE
ncbi:UDP-glycosyltransferase UGT5-like isoform X1 [Schistocerca nitens]|uniref:UDP-glycosyltransferase UGT5-like isoform X1 n=2 Tax=Schistocerca nitens TaxID=7011 RepID=UPI0021176672|nr:UDP-glycosyltransferase UGT5-like isoform X1 [Schistocerca nitens]XP_049793135.1 UDP-glycosyltransferase UGT5-like isoform X1 [Schistocerca nitens]XP_049793136.1 UDP-glycosyltransferase UGT5-like isoform X1 [Schistocerca nitens]